MPSPRLALGPLALALIATWSGCKKDETKGESESAPTPEPSVPTPIFDAGPPLPPHRTFADPASALKAMLDESPARVLGIGEVHVLVGGPPVRSALSRFSDTMLPVLRGKATDLVIETWVADGRCGQKEAAVTTSVKRDTDRPPEVESELEALIRRAREHDTRPRVLVMKCEYYDQLRPDGGDVDYDKLLTLIGRELGATIAAARSERDDAMVVAYGGSLHNDREPYESVAAYSYGAPLVSTLGDDYVELDLYVPELVADDELMAGEAWFPLLAHAGEDKVILFERGPHSYILIMRKGQKARPPAQAPGSPTTP